MAPENWSIKNSLGREMYMCQYVMPLLNSVADTYLGSGPFLTPGSGIQNMFYRIPDLWAWILNAYIGKLCDNVLGEKFQCCGSGMCIPDPNFSFLIPDPNSLHPGSRVRIKEFNYFNHKKTKKMFLSCRKYDPGCSSRIPDPGSGCWLSTYPGSRIQGSKRH